MILPKSAPQRSAAATDGPGLDLDLGPDLGTGEDFCQSTVYKVMVGGFLFRCDDRCDHRY